jgi:hypothetical protein
VNFVEIFGIKMRKGNYFGYGLAVNSLPCGRGDGERK